jgi:YVTN family beta-propeller protein
VEAIYQAPGKGAHFIAILPNEAKLYLSNKEGDLGVFDLRRREFLDSVPVGAPGLRSGNGSGSEGLVPTPDGARLLVVDNDRSDLRVIDTATDREIDRVPLLMCPPTNPKRSRLMRLAISPDACHLVVTSYASGVAWLLDGKDYRQQTLVPVAKGPQGTAFAPDGRTALVANHDSGIITEIDLAAKRATRAHDGGAGIEVLAFY